MKYIKSYNESNNESLVKLASDVEWIDIFENKILFKSTSQEIDKYKLLVKSLYPKDEIERNVEYTSYIQITVNLYDINAY